jgi:hypothetical protein
MMHNDPENLQNPQQKDATACKLAAKKERKGCVRIAFSFRWVTGRGGLQSAIFYHILSRRFAL